MTAPRKQRFLGDVFAKSMSDAEVQVGAQLENSPSRQQTYGGLVEEDEGGGGGGGEPETRGRARHPDAGAAEVDDRRWPLFEDVALTPRRGDPEVCSCLEVEEMDERVQSMRLKLQYFTRQADDLQFGLLSGQGVQGRATVAVERLLNSCRPFFSDLEAAARSTRPLHLPVGIFTRLLEISQQLCDRLEQLVLTFYSYNLLCVDDAEPNSVSPFCLGQAQLGHLRVTTFRYWEPVPYLAQINSGLYKRMRWNVERFRVEQQTSEEQGGQSTERRAENEYYFLCYEDIPSTHAETDGDGHSSSHSNTERMWSIGLWVQVDPDPNTDDIYDWILCEVPQATYHKLLLLGSAEPSSCTATDYLQTLLLSQQTTH